MQESRMGGIEYNSVHLAEKMNLKRFDIVFLCPGEGKLPELLRSKKIPFLFYRRPGFFSTSVRIGGNYFFNPFATAWNFLSFFVITSGLAGILKRENFKIIFTKGLLANFYGGFAARAASIPCVWDMQEIVSNRKAFGLFSMIQNIWAVLTVNRILASSEAIRNQFCGAVRRKTSVVPNGIDTEFYKPVTGVSEVRREWKLTSEEVLISHIARLTYWKGQKDFLKAAAEIAKKMPRVKFAVVGSPVFENHAYEQEIRQLASELGLDGRVLFPGFRNDLKEVLSASDIFVHSSTEPEGCPITLITAMSMGVPSVITGVEGNTEIVSSQDQALVVSPGKPEEIAAALLRILNDPELADKMRKSARKRAVERHSIESYVRGCEGVFENIAK